MLRSSFLPYMFTFDCTIRKVLLCVINSITEYKFFVWYIISSQKVSILSIVLSSLKHVWNYTKEHSLYTSDMAVAEWLRCLHIQGSWGRALLSVKTMIPDMTPVLVGEVSRDIYLSCDSLHNRAKINIF